jgi:hypothetical protein
MTKDSPATIGDVLNIEIYHHCIDFRFFNHLTFEFAWWAQGEDFSLLEFEFLTFGEGLFTIFDLQIGKTSINLFWEN